MNEVVVLPETERRLAAGLSPALLAHAAQGQKFLGFISYRRRDGLVLARWLRDRISSFQPPAELKAKIAAMDESVGGKQNRVFFDMSYQRPNVDFWDEHIAASLCRSSTLILLQTPSVFEQLDDGEPNWCEREIETYLKYYGEPSRILVVMAPGAPIDRFPAPLANISARWDWIDLRFFSDSPLQRFRHGGQYDPLLAKILAKIYNISDGDLPLLNREFAKSRARVRRALAIAACVAIVSLSGLTAWALLERDRATAAEKVAVEQRDTAIKQRNAALIAQSRFLAKAADEQSSSGSTRAAISILRDALPDVGGTRDRPLVSEAVASAYRALYGNREMGRLPMPSDAAAVVGDGRAGRIIIATPDRLIVRAGVDDTDLQEWPHDFGPAQSIALADSGSRLVMTSANGAVMVRDLADNRLLLRDPGSGRGTKVWFVSGGTRLLISDAGQLTLRLFDLDGGRLLATRSIEPGKGKPVFCFADGDFVAVVANSKLMRLSIDDLSIVLEADVPDMSEHAMALSPDRARVYLAVAERVGFGSVLAFEALTFALQRSFGRLAFGATSMAASPTRGMLAVTNSSGIDFFDVEKFETIGHVTSMPISGGRFLKDSFFYIGYNSYGDILQVVPELLTTTAYKTIDGGGIRQIDVFEDGSGFLSLSDRPSITRWAFDPKTSSMRMAVPLIVKNVDMKTSLSIAASDFSEADDTLLTAYFNGQIRRWNLHDGTSKVINDAGSWKLDEKPLVAAMGNGIAVVAAPSGMIQIYHEAAGSAAPVAQIATDAISTLLAVSSTSAFVVTEGQPKLLDVTDATHPKLSVLDKLGQCPRSGGTTDTALCVDADGALRALRLSDNTIVANLPSQATGLSAAAVAPGGKALVVADMKGNVEWRDGEGAVVRKWAIKGTLRGKMMPVALARNLLSPSEAAAVRAGAASVDIPMSPVQFDLNADQTLAAAVMPNGAIKLITPQDDKVIDIPAREGRFISSVKFSAKGQFLAVVDHVDASSVVSAMVVVYDTQTGNRMFAFNSDPEFLPTVHALSNGRAFVTVNPRGTILKHPAFDQSKEFIAFLAENYPVSLTSEQRRFFFID